MNLYTSKSETEPVVDQAPSHVVVGDRDCDPVLVHVGEPDKSITG